MLGTRNITERRSGITIKPVEKVDFDQIAIVSVAKTKYLTL